MTATAAGVEGNGLMATVGEGMIPLGSGEASCGLDELWKSYIQLTSKSVLMHVLLLKTSGEFFFNAPVC